MPKRFSSCSFFSFDRKKEADLLDFTQKLTDKNVILQSDLVALEAKSSALEAEHSKLVARIGELETDCSQTKVELEEERKKRKEETELLVKKLAEKSKQVTILRVFATNTLDLLKNNILWVNLGRNFKPTNPGCRERGSSAEKEECRQSPRVDPRASILQAPDHGAATESAAVFIVFRSTELLVENVFQYFLEQARLSAAARRRSAEQQWLRYPQSFRFFALSARLPSSACG